MLTSERRHCIRFDGAEDCFKFKNRTGLWPDPNPHEGEQRLVGVGRVLRQVCYPNYSYEAASVAGAGQFASQRVATGLAAPHHGQKRGREVHQQLAEYVNHGRASWTARYGINCSAFVPRIIDFLRSRNLVPLVGEFQDFFNGIGIGSAIDLLCRDTEHDGVALIELKVGGENGFEKSNDSLRAPASLRHNNNSPLTQARLQLLVYRAMITANYPYVRVTRCYVLQARTDKLVLYGLMQPFIEAQQQLVDALAESRRRESAARVQRRSAAAAMPSAMPLAFAGGRGRPRGAAAWRCRGSKRAAPWMPEGMRSSRARWR